VNGATLAVMAKRSYRLTVQGELSDNLQPDFPGMKLTRSDGSTALAGPVRDRPSPKVSYTAGAMLAVAAFGGRAGRVGEDVAVPEESGDGDGWFTNSDRGW
jgi:hypothetical protein